MVREAILKIAEEDRKKRNVLMERIKTAMLSKVAVNYQKSITFDLKLT